MFQTAFRFYAALIWTLQTDPKTSVEGGSKFDVGILYSARQHKSILIHTDFLFEIERREHISTTRGRYESNHFTRPIGKYLNVYPITNCVNASQVLTQEEHYIPNMQTLLIMTYMHPSRKQADKA